VILHEIGHAIGLGDSADPTSIMYATASSSDRTLSSADGAAVRALYSGGAAGAIGASGGDSTAGLQISPIGLTRAPSTDANAVTSATPAAASIAGGADSPSPHLFIHAMASFTPAAAVAMDPVSEGPRPGGWLTWAVNARSATSQMNAHVGLA